MKISERTISALARVVTGDGGISPYRSGPNLVRFFNELGSNDVYASGFPSRWYYVEGKIRELNDSLRVDKVFESVLDPRDYLSTEFSVETVAQHLNEYLRYDGYDLVKQGNTYRVQDLLGAVVDLEIPSEGISKVSHVFIEDQIKKCNRKVFEGDFAGAITNARSLLEAVLLEIEGELTQQSVSYDGDLTRLWRRTQGLLNLDPSRKDIADALRQVLGGLTSTVAGVATLRNKMSDAHATNYLASKRHAKLAVNAAMTIVDFITEVFSEQTGRVFEAHKSGQPAIRDTA